jgi:outer membrane protein assembly factor BamB
MRSFFVLTFACSTLHAADWPQWMGPTRDGVWTEQGILDAFPEGGPKLLWKKPLAAGYSGPAVMGGRVVVMDYAKSGGDDKPDPIRRSELSGQERVVCFDSATGEPKWLHAYDCPYSVSYASGPRCTPTLADGAAYCLGTMGRLTALDLTAGKPLWEREFTKEYAAKVPVWGFAGHPLVHKQLLICLVGGPDALLVAFDRTTGKEVWKALRTPPEEGPGYCPPSIVEAGGVMQLIVWHPHAIVSLNPDTGAEYWSEPLKPSHGMSIMMPRKGGDLLYAAGYQHAAVTLKLDAKSPAATVHWRGQRTTAIYPANSTPIVDGDTLYGVDAMGQLRAAKLSTGERLWNTTAPVVDADDKPVPHGTAFLVKNGDKYFLFNEKGTLIVAKLSPAKYEEAGRAKLIEPTTTAFNRTVVWSHPAFASKCAFVRNDREIACYSLAK